MIVSHASTPGNPGGEQGVIAPTAGSDAASHPAGPPGGYTGPTLPAHVGSPPAGHEAGADLESFLRGDPVDQTPNLDLVRLFHRANDGYCSLHREGGGKFDLYSLRGDQLRGAARVFGCAVRKHLDADSLFGVNSYFRAGWWDSPVFNCFDAVLRGKKHLRWLNACFADPDCHAANMDPADVVREVVRLEDAGAIPRASIVSLSGRGVWLFWLLRDPADPTLPQRAWREDVRRYDAVQSGIARRLAHFGSEAKDAARVTRVPGSLNTKSGRRVKYWVRRGAGQAPPTYTLADLTVAFPSRPAERTLGPRRGEGAVKPNPNKQRGYDAMRDFRLRQFDSLWAMRGGFREGTRALAALVYARTLSMHGYESEQLRNAVYALGAECRPPLPHAECDKAVVSVTAAFYPLRDRTISDWLDVTPDESAKLGGWPPASKHGLPDDDVRGGRGERARARARRKLIRDLVGGGPAPTVRAMANALSDHGHEASRGTVQNDYEALALGTGRRANRRRGDGRSA